jgi:hypothetical protein
MALQNASTFTPSAAQLGIRHQHGQVQQGEQENRSCVRRRQKVPPRTSSRPSTAEFAAGRPRIIPAATEVSGCVVDTRLPSRPF